VTGTNPVVSRIRRPVRRAEMEPHHRSATYDLEQGTRGFVLMRVVILRALCKAALNNEKAATTVAATGVIRSFARQCNPRSSAT
jgi:hypothetical protein